MRIMRSSGRGRERETLPHIVAIVAATMAWVVFAVASAEAQQPQWPLEEVDRYDASNSLLQKPICLGHSATYMLTVERAGTGPTSYAELDAGTEVTIPGRRLGADGSTLARVSLPLRGSTDRRGSEGFYAPRDFDFGFDFFTPTRNTPGSRIPGAGHDQWCGVLQASGSSGMLLRIRPRYP